MAVAQLPSVRIGCGETGAPGLVLAGLLATAAVGGCADTPATGVDCSMPTVHCATTPTPAFDAAGELWVAFAHNGRVYVSRSARRHTKFGNPVAVTAMPEELDVNGENRPKIAFGPGGEIYVSWTRKLPGGFNGEIRFSRSIDGGRRFEAPRTVNDDQLVTGHRFETLHVDDAGNVYLVWIDKRDLVAAESAGRPYVGAAVYFAVSTDAGATFGANRKVADSSCECCRIAAAPAPQGEVALFYRGVFDGHTRDHAFAIIGTGGVTMPAVRATWDGWRLDACPHHGPAMLSAGNSGFHLAWFTGGTDRQGIFYARLDPLDGSLSRLYSVAATPAAGHPSLASGRAGLVLAWKEFDGQSTRVRVIRSTDGGASWSAPVPLATTLGGSDHPLLVSNDGDVFLSWHTGDEGLRVLPVSFGEGG